VAALAPALSSLAAFAATANAAPARGSITAVPVNRTAQPTGVPVVGTFNVTSFRVIDGVVNAVCTFTGTVNGVLTTTAVTSHRFHPAVHRDVSDPRPRARAEIVNLLNRILGGL
jgi:hypothetical protein